MHTQLQAPNREEARAQFDYWTNALSLEHTFDFDEAWDYAMHKRWEQEHPGELRPPEVLSNEPLTEADFQIGITELQSQIESAPGGMVGEDADRVNPVKHSFADGVYIREICNPAGELIVTKIHKKSHPFFLMRGDMSIMSQSGVVRIRAPYHGITQPGTKRIIFTHTECIFITVHATRLTDMAEIEKEIISTSFADKAIT